MIHRLGSPGSGIKMTKRRTPICPIMRRDDIIQLRTRLRLDYLFFYFYNTIKIVKTLVLDAGPVYSVSDFLKKILRGPG